MGFTEKTNYLLETKSLLKDRINSLGGSITSGTTFRDYLVWLDSLYEALDEMTITGLPDSLEGKCEQTGTPTPTSPQPINITTGRQVVSVVGKNLLYKDFYQSSANAIKCELLNFPSGTYTWSFTNQNIPGEIQVKTKVNGSYQTYANAYSKNQLTFTLNTSQDIQLESYRAGGNPLSNYSNMMLEKGNTPSTYEEYKGNDYEINLGKNLLNIDGTRTSEGLTNTTSGTIISVSGTSSNTYSSLTQQITQNIPIGTYTFSIQETYSKRIGFVATFSDNTNTTYNITANTLSTTFTTSKEIISYRLYMETTSGTTYNMTIKPQLEKGSVASSFSPYKTPIYLGKIGTYQDRIFKNTTENPLYDSNLEEGQWYIHKEIGKYTFTGSENWTKNTYGTNSWYITNLVNAMYIDTIKTIMSNIFYGLSNSERASSYTNKIYVDQWNNTSIRDTTLTTNAEVQNATKGNYIYYVLNTPTNTLIEDEELINQLNEIDIFTVISEDFYN